jgi:hypothetical protein
MIFVGILAFGGCSTDIGPSEAELKSRWETQNIVPTDYKGDLLAFLRTYLNDPSSVRDAGVSTPQLKPFGPGPRYVACVRFNARSSGGNYQGMKEGAAIYVSGTLDRFLDRARDVRDFCKDATYVSFPELEKLSR